MYDPPVSTRGEDRHRRYEKTHPWINFTLFLDRLEHSTWLLLGEARSKCEHVAGVPLQPAMAQLLHEIYLSKGVHATTSIEGNTLSEEQVLARIEGELELPPSRAYQGQEIDNILEACNSILWDVSENPRLPLTVERVKHFNKLVLRGLPLDGEDTVPGEVREHPVGVARYQGAPAEDCEYLLERLCAWLEKDFVADDQELLFTVAILKAIMAHLYIAWIHPFGDGNGRTARLIEFQLLVQAGLPSPAAHLLSDHYNLTRDAYYRELDRTSKPPYAVERFIQYAMRGFVDALRAQLAMIRAQQMEVTWEHYVHSEFHGQDTKAPVRQKHLVLDLPADGPTPPNKIRVLTPRQAVEYHGKGPKTVTRDVNALVKQGLVVRVKGGILPNREIVRAFLPFRSPPPPTGRAVSRRA